MMMMETILFYSSSSSSSSSSFLFLTNALMHTLWYFSSLLCDNVYAFAIETKRFRGACARKRSFLFLSLSLSLSWKRSRVRAELFKTRSHFFLLKFDQDTKVRVPFTRSRYRNKTISERTRDTLTLSSSSWKRAVLFKTSFCRPRRGQQISKSRSVSNKTNKTRYRSSEPSRFKGKAESKELLIKTGHDHDDADSFPFFPRQHGSGSATHDSNQ